MQPLHYFLIVFFVLAPIAAFLQNLRQKKKIRRYLREQFGKAPAAIHPDKLTRAAKYHQACAAVLPEYAALESITWNDLEMDQFFHAINATLSSVGEEVLYARLHRLDGPDLEALIRRFLEDEPLRLEVSRLLYGLSKDYENSVHDFLFDPASQKMVGYALWQSYLPLAGAALVFLSPPAGIAIAALAVLWNFRTRAKYKTQAAYGIDTLRYVAAAVTAAKAVTKCLENSEPESARRLRSAWEPLSGVPSRLPLRVTPGDLLSALVEYLHYTLLLDFHQYNRALRILICAPEALRRFWESLGDVEIALCIASLEQRLPLTKPRFHDEPSIRSEEIYHPLVADPVTNPVDFSRSILISGSNASGKSTYVKAIALSAITSQNLGRAFAKSFEMKRGKVITSMALRDNLYEGDSYFVAEVKSLRRMIKSSESGEMVYLFIDEILKGTNTIERIASSNALLDWFHRKNILVIAATHDIELTELQAEKMKNLHFRESVTREEVVFDYRVKPGPTRTTNAINLLRYYGFPEELTEQAMAMADDFRSRRSWRKEKGVADEFR